MSSAVIVIAGVAIVVYTIGSQILGTAIRAKRLVILPAIITVIGVVNVAGHSSHPTATDILLIVLGAVIAAGVGLTLGYQMRLERRDGWLWGQLAKRGLWLWLIFFLSRGALIAVAHAAGAHVAAGTHAELLILGVNRVAQAAVIGMRALAAGIPFAPESDGSSPLGGLFGAGANPPVRDDSADPGVDGSTGRVDAPALRVDAPARGGLRSGRQQGRRAARRARRGR